MVKARNQNQDCAMCCNPTPTEVYKHLPGFVKLLCELDKNSSLYAPKLNPTFTGNRVVINSVTPTIMMVNTANNAEINALELSANQEVKVGNGALIMQGNGGTNSVYIQNNNGNVGIGTNLPTSKLNVVGTVKATSFSTSAIQTAPATATSTGVAGEIRFTATGVYICISTNTWIKCTGATF